MSDANPDTNNTTNQTALPTHDDSPQSSKCKQTEQNALLDLHIDCLEHIFGYLNYADLANVAELDANALAAAQLVFSRRYSNYLVEMYTERGYKVRSVKTTRSFAPRKISECKKMLRNFGKCMKRLQLNDFSDLKMSRNRIAIMNLIDKKCTKTLVELTLYKCEQQFSDGIENVFENVETLRVQYTSLGKWKELNKWFPKLKRLELIKPMQIITRPLSESDVKAIIKTAPQLHTLALTGHMNVSYLRFINDNLPMLKSLILPDFKLAENPTKTKVFFENVESFSIIDKRTNGTLRIPFEFKQLKELDIDATMHFGTFMKWIDFAIQQRDLIKLRIKAYYWTEIQDRQVNEIAAKLTKLTEFLIHIDEVRMPLGHVITLLNCQSMKKLEVCSLSPADAERAVALATGKWLLFQNNQQFVFTRETDN